VRTLGRTESCGMRIEASAAEAAAFREFLEIATGMPVQIRLDMLGDLAPAFQWASTQMQSYRAAQAMRLPCYVWAGAR